MFTTLIVKPLFNLLVLIYGLLPGHNFGLALIIFTVIIRLLLWPLVKKQLHQTKLMRQLQPDIKRIKKQTKGDKQKEMAMTMELYKEKGFSPYASFPTLIVQFIVLIGLYSGINRVIHDPHTLVTFAYPALQHLPFMQQLAHNIHLFDNTLFGIVDLSKSALNSWGVYWPAMVITIASAITQYYQSKQLLPSAKDSKSLRQILKQSSSSSDQPDQSDVNAAVGRSTRFLLPVMIFIITVRFAAALGLYWFVSGLVAFIQQSIVLKEDETEMEALGNKPSKDLSAIPEAEIIETTTTPRAPKPKAKKRPNKAKRRK